MKPDFEKKAAAIYDSLGRGSATDVRRIERALRAVFEMGRKAVWNAAWDAALEEALVVADRERTQVIGNDEYELGRNEAAIDIAANLHALKDAPKEKAG